MGTRNDEWLRTEICSQRMYLVGVLANLSEEEWNTPSLCEGWRVREVAAHLAMPFHWLGLRHAIESLLALRKAKGSNLEALLDQWARRDAAKFTTSKIVQVLDANIYRPYICPHFFIPDNYLGNTMGHGVMHSLDITIPLGRDEIIRPDTVRPMLNALARARDPAGEIRRRHQERGWEIDVLIGARVDLTDVMLCATDMDWKFGTGEPLYGKGRELVALLSERKLPPGRLKGAAQSRFTRDSSSH